MAEKKAVILLSGGLDSATVTAVARAEEYHLYCLSFDYGQRHAFELQAAERVAASMGAVEHLILRLDLGRIGGSSLTDHRLAVPKGGVHLLTGEIPSTYVPARNTIFIAHAVSWAETLGARDIFLGVNALDYSGYPDCRPEYVAAMERAVNLGTKLGVQEKAPYFRLQTPLISLRKQEIIALGLRLGVDYSLTHSCYEPDGRGNPCGLCDSCRLRLAGFKSNGLADPLPYQDQMRES
ncbi:MAG: 7-cyano-7-deazaguanine synthase QueC [Deltaproteobacteria bacterium]|nr:7-cyano-7-deazaguanine synthase QueC [Candidatus Anaeroferrophillus wilburensis]MBN2889864.1 7-cyano-7-deazaguanine synthase QueC [Deltaproteobacteria bacterium]